MFFYYEKFEKREERFSEMFFVFSLFSMDKYYYPLPEEFYYMDNLESNRRFHQILYSFSKFLIFFLLFTIISNFSIKYTVSMELR